MTISPCPWCQSADTSAETVHERHNSIRGYVECRACRSRGPLTGLLFADTVADLPVAHIRGRRAATELWNTRTHPASKARQDEGTVV